jgi:hypothetical protein
MTRDLYRHLQQHDLSRDAVMSIPLSTARKEWGMVRQSLGLVGTPALLTPPNGSAKASHGLTDVVPAATWMLYLLPSDSSSYSFPYHLVLDGTISHGMWIRMRDGWQTCRYATAGCRAACLAESGQQGMETRSGRRDVGHIFKGRLARLTFLGEAPASFFRLLAHELAGLPRTKWSKKGYRLGWRGNGISDVPFETLVPWLYSDVIASGVTPYDYTAWPTSRRSRATDLVYIVDSVKETHTDSDIAGMARPVVVLDIKRGHAIPATWRGRPTTDADLSDARWLDRDGTVRVLRYKHVASCSKAEAIASGFVKTA